jgi:hypothetical protein
MLATEASRQWPEIVQSARNRGIDLEDPQKAKMYGEVREKALREIGANVAIPYARFVVDGGEEARDALSSAIVGALRSRDGAIRAQGINGINALMDLYESAVSATSRSNDSR